MAFKTKLVVREPNGKPGNWILERDLIYQGKTDIIVVPKGFVTDFASVPKIFWNILPPFGKYTKAAVIHDYLYFTKMFSREDSDGIFLRIMEELEVSWVKRKTIYRAVRMFGWTVWDK